MSLTELFVLWYTPWLEIQPKNDGPPAWSKGVPMAKSGKSKRKLEIVHLVCEETGDYNYTIRKKGGGEKLKLKKYSPRLRKHTVHVEKKK